MAFPRIKRKKYITVIVVLSRGKLVLWIGLDWMITPLTNYYIESKIKNIIINIL